MQNADVPLWDKGDKTDDYVRGGGFSLFETNENGGNKPEIADLYELVLGRKPTSRELAYYRYSTAKKEDILKKLLNSSEHKEIIQKGRDYPDLEQQEKLDQSTILKLKHGINDQQGEITEMKVMLDEKNKEITGLREERDKPFVTGTFLENNSNVYYGNSRYEDTIKPKENSSWLDKLAKFIKNISELI